MPDIWQKLKNTPRPVFLYGTGNGADKILDELERLEIPVSGVFASDGFVRSRTFRSYTVRSYSEVKKDNPDMIALLSFGSSVESVIENIRRISGETTLFAPCVPVCGSDIFNSGFYEKNRAKIEQARELLFDDRSKEVFDNIINYRLSGEIKYLFDSEDDAENGYALLSLKDESFLDLGAYRGDTVIEAEKYFSPKAIFAVEPDKKSFEKLKINTAGIKNTEYFNCAAGEKDGDEFFSFGSGRGSHETESGKKTAVRSVDSLLAGRNAGFIKIDVEGREKETLLGAKDTVSKFSPKLKVACYHRSEDIFEILLLIKELNPSYKIGLRHRRSLPDWDTDCFAF